MPRMDLEAVNKMSTLVIKNLPDTIHALLHEQAKHNRRSITKEAVYVLEQGLTRQSVYRPLPPAVTLRSGRMLSFDDIESAIMDT